LSLSIVRLGTPRLAHEGLRIGTVRCSPRGVPKEQYAPQDDYDVWFPNLAPSEARLKSAKAEAAVDAERAWRSFARRFLAEMKAAGPRRDLERLAAPSRHTDLAIGCYCADASRCHRTLLRTLLLDLGAEIRDPEPSD
jgi:uncharacterized protein YeaO (DUF488 family)